MPTLSTAAATQLGNAKNTALDNVYNLADGGAGAATIKVYTGSRPASPNDTATGTLLATFTCADPAWGAAAAQAKALASTPRSATAAATGTPGWARLADSTGAAVADFTVGTSGTEMVTTSATWSTGQTVDLTSGVVTL